MNDDRLTVVPLGVGDAFTQKHYNTTLLLSAGGRHVLVDVPDPPRKVLHESCRDAGVAAGFETIDDIIVTHVHGDHANGVEAFGFWKFFVQKKRARLWSVPEVLGPLWEHKLKAAMGRVYDPECVHYEEVGLDHFFDVRPVSWTAPTEIAGLRIEIHAGRHPVPVFGLRVEYAGRRFGYSCDTMFLPEMIEFLSPCDLIFHETNYGPHTPYAKLAALPAALRSRMRLIHYPDDFDEAASVIECARQGRLYVV